jgi:Tol biopolymer transport system component
VTTRTDALDEGEPAWSPDGTKLAYVVGRAIYIHDLTSGATREIVDGIEPTFSPDGRWLAAARVRGTEPEVWLVPLTGGEPVLLARDARLPRWF